MKRVVLILVALVGAVAAFFVSMQLQWAIIRTGIYDEPCGDLLEGFSLCAGPQPVPFIDLVAAVIGGVVAVKLARRVATRRASGSSHKLLGGTPAT